MQGLHAKPRSEQAVLAHWVKRLGADPPFIVEEIHRRMVERARMLRPPEGAVVAQGWLHPAILNEALCLFGSRHWLVDLPNWRGAFETRASGAIDHEVLIEAWLARSSGYKFPWYPPLRKNGLRQRIAGLAQGVKSAFGLKESAGQLNPACEVDFTLSACDAALADNRLQSAAFVWAPMFLYASPNPEALMQKWSDQLKPQGGVFFSTLGPDSFKELARFADLLGYELPDYADMHDVGDALMGAGFSDPVMEMERLTLTYSHPNKLLGDLKALGGSFLSERPRGLLTPRRMQRALQEIESSLGSNGGGGDIRLTLEIVYGHAWKVPKRQKPTEARIGVDQIGGRKPLGTPKAE